MNFSHNELVTFPTKFSVKFTTSFPSSRFDWHLRNEIAKFAVNFENFKWTSKLFVKSFVKRTDWFRRENSEFCFPLTSMFISGFTLRDALRVSGKQNSVFPLGTVIKCLIGRSLVNCIQLSRVKSPTGDLRGEQPGFTYKIIIFNNL